MMNLFTSLRGYSVAASVTLLVVVTALLQMAPAWRIDLTEEELYTLGQGSKQLVADIEEPLVMKFFFSESVARELPQLRDYAQRIRDLLTEYEALNPGKLTLEMIDPEPFSEAEDEATLAGLQGAPVSLGGDTMYMGLVVERQSQQGQEEVAGEVIAFFNPERERFLEYDISQVIYRLGSNRQLAVGVISGVQMFGGYDFASRQSTGPWAIIEQLRGVAEVRQIHDSGLSLMDENLDVLLVAHPQNLEEKTLYAIDQFVLSGGRALVFVDPHAEINARMPGQASGSELGELLAGWGVDFDPGQIVGDSRWGLRISAANGGVPLPHVGIVGLMDEAMDRNSIITTELDSINVASSGYLLQAEGSSTQFQPLLQSSDAAALIESERYVSIRDHGELLNEFVPTGERYVLAAKISGEAASAFDAAPQPEPEKEPELDEQPEPEAAESTQKSEVDGDESAQEPEETESVPPHRDSGKVNVIVVADVDLLSDRLWVQVSNFFGQQVMVPWANNGDFVINAVENLGGSEALISLRSRGQYSRPFDVVNELRSAAAEKFKQQEQVLLQRLEQLEASIASLAPTPDLQGDAGAATLSDAQQAEIKAFEAQRLETRKQLRQVQHQLNESIDALEARLRWINIALVPALLMVLMVVVLVYRRRQSGL
jgi:ABC-type uncharacterized transport system involved in gliding motility auxiliary subunit